MFLSIFDKLSTLVSIFTAVPDHSYSIVVSILQLICYYVIKVWPLGVFQNLTANFKMPSARLLYKFEYFGWLHDMSLSSASK